jgi:hypothetical protein
MKIKTTYEGALINPAVAAEIEALYMEINALKETVKQQATVINANKDVLHELLDVLKNAEIPYRNK